jgi:hypothetical protein
MQLMKSEVTEEEQLLRLQLTAKACTSTFTEADCKSSPEAAARLRANRDWSAAETLDSAPAVAAPSLSELVTGILSCTPGAFHVCS